MNTVISQNRPACEYCDRPSEFREFDCYYCLKHVPAAGVFYHLSAGTAGGVVMDYPPVQGHIFSACPVIHKMICCPAGAYQRYYRQKPGEITPGDCISSNSGIWLYVLAAEPYENL